MSTIRQRRTKDGSVRYQVQIRVRGFPLVTATFDRLTDARTWSARTESELKLAARLPQLEARRHTLADAIDRYAQTHLPRKAPRTIPTQRCHLAFWRDALGRFTLDQLTTARIAAIRDTLTAAGKTTTTTNHYLTSLSAVLTVAVNEWSWIETNPARKIPRLQEPPGRVRFLSDDELERLLAAARADASPYLFPAIVLALSTGMRRAELFGLTRKDVDLKRGIVTLEKTKNRDRRSIPLTAAAQDALRALLALPLASVSGRIFPDRPQNSGYFNIRKPFDRAKRAAGIRSFRWHDLRHTAASYLAMAGVPLRTIGEILGHRTAQMSQRYAHLSREHLRDALNQIEGKFVRG